MADDQFSELKSIYDNTNYFVNAIVDEYDFYNNFIDAVKSGAAKIRINKKKIQINIDEQWIDAIEKCLPALDSVMRQPANEIAEQEEVLPIELSRHINNRSIRHLAQHTDYINSVEGDMIMPSKILNVYYDETIMTYENKFINTLIDRLFGFVYRRYKQLADGNDIDETVQMKFFSDFDINGSKGIINFNIELEEGKSTAKNSVTSNTQRIIKLFSVISQYKDSEFCKAMGSQFIRPPVMRTNAITKNKYLSQCLVLWEYIESYENVGYNLSVDEDVSEPKKEYLDQLYSLLSLQFMTFKYNLQEDFEGITNIVKSKKSENPIAPVFDTEIKDINVNDYNVYDSEYRRVVHISQLSNRGKLSKGELDIRKAIDVAFKADKIYNSKSKSKGTK